MLSFGTAALRGKGPSYKKLHVELVFNYLNQTFKIERKISDASLQVKGKDDKFTEIANSTSIVNQKLISLLGYDYTIYLLSNYCQQGELQYFSKLTPAKRLAFIDKVSGVEEAKELKDWLEYNKKSLKESLSMIKDMTIKPEKPSIDFEFDYDKALKDLDTKFKSLTLYYEQLKVLENNIQTLNLFVPEINKNYIEKLDSLTSDQKQSLLNSAIRLSEIATEVSILEKELSSYPKFDQKYLNVSFATIKSHIEYYDYASLNTLKNSIHISCPSCKGRYILADCINIDSTFTPLIPKTILYQLKDFVLNDRDEYLAIKNKLEILLKEEQDIEQSFIIKDMVNYSYNQIQDLFKNNSLYKNQYEEALQKYHVDHNQYEKLQVQINKIKDDIETFLAEQEGLYTLKESYLKANIEKSIYLKQLEIYDKALSKFNTIKSQYDLTLNLIKDVEIESDKIKKATIPLITYHASYYLSKMTNGVMTKIEITDNYDLIVDGTDINLKSGGEKDISSLAFRLSLGQSIILGMLPLFIGDEIDSSSTVERTEELTEALQTMSKSGYQMILITHKDTSNLEDCNIIDLG